MTSKIVVNNIEADSGISTVTFNSNIKGNLIGNVTGNVNTTGVSTFSDIRVTGGTISGISTLGVTTAYVAQLAGVGAGTSIQIPSGSKLVGLSTGSVYAPGTILQVVNATYSTQIGNPTATYADTGLTATITPTSASSKILIIVFQAGLGKINSDSAIALKLLRGSTDLVLFEGVAGYTNSASYNYFAGSGTTYLDSPNTTSSVTYKTQFKSPFGTGAYVQLATGSNVATSTITLMEVAA